MTDILEREKSLSAENVFCELFHSASEKQMAQLLLEMDDSTFYKSEQALFAQCAKTQETILLELLHSSKDTEFGKKYNFSEIKTVEDFRKAVPLSKWGDYKEYVQKLEDAEEDILFPGKAQFFYVTSGTTGGLKNIPESLREKIARKAILRARITEMFLQFSGDVSKRILMFVNRLETQKTSGGIEKGSASGRTSEMIPLQMEHALAYPMGILDVCQGEEMRYVMLRCALYYADLKCVLGNNALVFREMIEFACQHALELIQDIREGTCRYQLPEILKSNLQQFTPNPQRADELQSLYERECFTPRYYWKEMRAAGFWLGGSVGVYAESLKELLPEETQFMDVGYGSSEAKINIPTHTNTPAGVLSTFSSFYEFIPEDGGEPLLAHQLKDGECYELVVTTYAGLYRYCMKDLVKVDGFTKDTPNLYFISKLADVANLASEKIPGVELSKVIRNFISENGSHCVGLQVYPDSSQTRYELHIELNEGESIDEIEVRLDAELREKIFTYNIVRDLGIQPLTVLWMKCGWSEWMVKKYQKNNATSAQVKVPIIVMGRDDEWIVSNIKGL